MIRLAIESDAEAIADVFIDIRRDTVPLIHPREEVIAWLRSQRFTRRSSFVWEHEGVVLGWLDMLGEELDQLYIKRGHTGLGLGKQLLDWAKARSPGRLRAFTFQVNHGARRFYAREGFIEVRLSDGTGNEEGQPDVELRWSKTGNTGVINVSRGPAGAAGS
jgi:GNAT superfamily N-acetyltransferase